MERRDNPIQKYQQIIDRLKRKEKRYYSQRNQEWNEQRYKQEKQVAAVESNIEMDQKNGNQYDVTACVKIIRTSNIFKCLNKNQIFLKQCVVSKILEILNINFMDLFKFLAINSFFSNLLCHKYLDTFINIIIFKVSL